MFNRPLGAESQCKPQGHDPFYEKQCKLGDKLNAERQRGKANTFTEHSGQTEPWLRP